VGILLPLACGISARHNAVHHEILECSQDSHVFCLGFMVPVLRISVLGFE